MARSTLPERASLDFLKKLAKERLRELRAQNPAAKLTAAQLALAREYGFSSWRELKAEIDRRQGSKVDAVFDACLAGDAAALRPLLDANPGLAHARRKGSSALHAAVISAECVRLLLARGADPNARDDGDNASPLHFAAARAASTSCASCSVPAPTFTAAATPTGATSSAGRSAAARASTLPWWTSSWSEEPGTHLLGDRRRRPGSGEEHRRRGSCGTEAPPLALRAGAESSPLRPRIAQRHRPQDAAVRHGAPAPRAGRRHRGHRRHGPHAARRRHARG